MSEYDLERKINDITDVVDSVKAELLEGRIVTAYAMMDRFKNHISSCANCASHMDSELMNLREELKEPQK